jgi:hypothetical protein
MNTRSTILIRHFFSRFFDKDSISPGAEPHANVIQIVAMLALPGAILSLFTIADHPLIRSELMTLWYRAGDRYTFVCYAMVVMGFVMTFKWDSLFPDRRDYLILTPLPISLREFFTAKVLSLGQFLLLFVTAINLFSCIIVPYAFGVRNNAWRFVPPAFLAHAAAVLGASIFTALLFAAFQGVLINLMSPGAFRRISAWIQMAAMTFLLTVLLLTPGISANLQLLVEGNVHALDYIPVFWFLGVYEVLNPEGTLIPAAPQWAATAVEAMAVAALIFVATYLVSYRRYSKKILEGIESNVFRERLHQRAAAWVLNRTFLRHPFQRAAYYFISRIFGRSAKHRLFIAMYGGIGCALTISSLFVLRRDTNFVIAISPGGLIEAPLILSFVVVSGLRATFNIPYELGANWMFQIAGGANAAEYLKAARKWVFLRGIVPVYAALAPLEFALLDRDEAVFRLAFGLAIATLLTEFFFHHFNKVPFTCSYLPAKSHLAFLGGVYLYGFTIYTFTIAGLERWVGQSPSRMMLFFASTAAIVVLLSWRRTNGEGRRIEIIYEDDPDPLVQQLNLT